MRTVDFREVKDAGEFTPIPEGSYIVEIQSAEEDETKKGDDRLNLRLRVAAGEHEGAVVFDRFHFSPRALPRLKLLLKALGVDTSGEVEVTPALLEGRRCTVDVVIDSYVKSDGSEAQSNTVPFAGYHTAENEEGYAPF